MKRNKLFGVIIILIGIFIPLTKYLINKNTEVARKEEVVSYINETSIVQISESTEEPEYSLILEVPKIKLKRGIYDIDNKYNDISYNIAIMDTSKMPDVINSNLILAAHNGSSDVSFFKDLEKLEVGDIVNVYYQGYKYIYEVDNYYEVDKTGYVNIHRNKTKNTITLITCKNDSDDKQIVYIGYLISKEAY